MIIRGIEITKPGILSFAIKPDDKFGTVVILDGGISEICHRLSCPINKINILLVKMLKANWKALILKDSNNTKIEYILNLIEINIILDDHI